MRLIFCVMLFALGSLAHSRGVVYNQEAFLFVPAPYTEAKCMTKGGDFYTCKNLDIATVDSFFKDYVAPIDLRYRPDICDLKTAQTPAPIILMDQLFLALFSQNCEKINSTPVNDYNVLETFRAFFKQIKNCYDAGTDRWSEDVQTKTLANMILLNFPDQCGGYQLRLAKVGDLKWGYRELSYLAELAYYHARDYKRTMWFDSLHRVSTFEDFGYVPLVAEIIRAYYAQLPASNPK